MDESAIRSSNVFYFPIAIKLSDLLDCVKSKEELAVKQTNTLASCKEYGRITEVNCTTIALFRFGSRVYAIDNACPHQGGPLHLGDIENLICENDPCGISIPCIVCPWHRWTFRLDNGNRIIHGELSATSNDDTVGMDCDSNFSQNQETRHNCSKVYPVRINNNGQLSIEFDQFDHNLFVNQDF